ncbi:cytochrome c biogenesis protein ResB [bacterium]|nr:cytochrome c biogenesis protein ResB [bacterium]UNM09311.1 MAG: cytochrome c biogenesis protein ResB [Planctomycetales bacterium]
MAAHKTWGPFNFLWKWLNSLPIAIYVMLLLALLNALGTVLPQEHLVGGMSNMPIDQQYIQKYGEQRWEIIRLLGLHHIYFTPVFFISLVWLCVSATVCNITRFKRTMREWKTPAVKRGAGFYRADRRAIEFDVEKDAPAADVAKLLRDEGFRVVEETDDKGARCIYGDRGFYQRWGMVVLHVAVLVLLFGGIYGSIFGNKGNVRMADGEQQTLTLDVAAGKHPLVKWFLNGLPKRDYQLSQDRFRIDYGRKLILPTVLQNDEEYSDDFQEYSHYFVKDYVSTLTAERNGQTVSAEVIVNHPLVIDKLMLFQSGYEQSGFLSMTVDGKTTEELVPAEMWIGIIPDMAGNPRLARAEDAVGRTDTAFLLEKVKAGDLYIDGKLDRHLGPMTVVHKHNLMTNEVSDQILDTEKGFKVSMDGQWVELKLADRIQNFSIFSYKRDPGMPMLYLGWILMIIGIGVALYVPFHKVNVRVEDGQAMLLVSGARGGGLKGLKKRIHAILTAG